MSIHSRFAFAFVFTFVYAYVLANVFTDSFTHRGGEKESMEERDRETKKYQRDETKYVAANRVKKKKR